MQCTVLTLVLYINAFLSFLFLVFRVDSYTKTPEDTVAAALHGGCDLDCGGFYPKNTQVRSDGGRLQFSAVLYCLLVFATRP